MDKHIKELGEYEVEIKLYHSVNANIKINVVNMETLEGAETKEEAIAEETNKEINEEA